MKFYEFEGHKILARAGIESPFFVTCASVDEAREARKRLKFPIVAKVQVLAGRRGRGGGIEIFKTEKKLLEFCREKFGKEFNGEEVRFINLAEKINIEEEYYASITYGTVSKLPFLLFSFKGGVDIEEVKQADSEAILKLEIDPIKGLGEKDLKKVVGRDENLIDFCMRLWDAFCRYDCRLVEVNPIAKVGNGYLAVDAKVILDDNGLGRNRDLDILPKGAISAIPTRREIEARKIDSEDYRGSAGSTFIEFDGSPRGEAGSPRFAGEADSPRGEAGSPRGEAGDIAILASGGGASLLVMDAVVAAGGRPANYTEYSGNPPAEKVEKLTKITLSREGISGCLVVGAVANFTDIYETLSGFVEGLKQIRPKPDYPIVIRRGGPRQEEAYKMLGKFAEKEVFDIHLFGPETPISVACSQMVELARKYKSEKDKSIS